MWWPIESVSAEYFDRPYFHWADFISVNFQRAYKVSCRILMEKVFSYLSLPKFHSSKHSDILKIVLIKQTKLNEWVKNENCDKRNLTIKAEQWTLTFLRLFKFVVSLQIIRRDWINVELGNITFISLETNPSSKQTAV